MEYVVDALFEALREPFTLDEQIFEIQVSGGLVVRSVENCALEMLLQQADLALYAAKGDGKNAWSMYNSQMCKDYQDKCHLKDALREAMENGDLMLAYQPVVDMKTRKVVGCEALARWHHRELGIIPPYIFVPLAEEMGLVSKITDWALHTATKECVTWPGNVKVAVNISAWDFKGDNVQKMVFSALRESGLSPERLEIEVTETVLVQELEVASQALGEVSSQGVGIALDDLGTGYSSLGYLHDLPFSKLKIDRTFSQNVTSDPRARKLMRNIAVLGKDLNMIVTVEGVETQDQLDVVAGIGLIDSVQGYLFGAPVPQSEIANLIVSLSGKSPDYLSQNQAKPLAVGQS
jgi:predicted signal transduction protein with EAL and GGDEF domain